MTELEMFKKAMELEMYECTVTDEKGIRRMVEIPQAADLLELAELEGMPDPGVWEYNEPTDLRMGAHMVDADGRPVGISIEFY